MRKVIQTPKSQNQRISLFGLVPKLALTPCLINQPNVIILAGCLALNTQKNMSHLMIFYGHIGNRKALY
jgi:hypothetical protein